MCWRRAASPCAAPLLAGPFNLERAVDEYDCYVPVLLRIPDEVDPYDEDAVAKWLAIALANFRLAGVKASVDNEGREVRH